MQTAQSLRAVPGALRLARHPRHPFDLMGLPLLVLLSSEQQLPNPIPLRSPIHALVRASRSRTREYPEFP